MYLCFTFASLPSSWLHSAFCLPNFLRIHVLWCYTSGFFFSLMYIILKFVWVGFFSFLPVSISPAHKTYRSLFSNFCDLFTDSVLIWYLQVLPFCWVWVTALVFPNLCHLYPLTYFFIEQLFISDWIPYNSNSCRQLPDKLIHHGILSTSIISSVSTVL